MSNFELVQLVNGPAIPVAALETALSLERRGFQLKGSQGRLFVSRSDGQDVGGLLSADDRAQIQKWKLHLLVVVEYRLDH